MVLKTSLYIAVHFMATFISWQFLSKSRSDRSSRPEVFCKNGVLRNFAKFTRKHLCQSLFFNKIAGLRPAILLKRDSGTGVFLWVLWNFEEHLFSQNTSGGCFWLLHLKRKCASLYNKTIIIATFIHCMFTLSVVSRLVFCLIFFQIPTSYRGQSSSELHILYFTWAITINKIRKQPSRFVL